MKEHILEPAAALLCMALSIWLLTFGGLIGLIGSLLTLPGRGIEAIGSWLVRIGSDLEGW